MTIEIGIIVSIAGLIVTLVNAWLLYLISEARKDRTQIWKELTDLRRALADFKEHVAREYPTKGTLTASEERVLDAIERLNSRLDRLFEHRPSPPT